MTTNVWTISTSPSAGAAGLHEEYCQWPLALLCNLASLQPPASASSMMARSKVRQKGSSEHSLLLCLSHALATWLSSVACTRQCARPFHCSKVALMRQAGNKGRRRHGSSSRMWNLNASTISLISKSKKCCQAARVQFGKAALPFVAIAHIIPLIPVCKKQHPIVATDALFNELYSKLIFYHR